MDYKLGVLIIAGTTAGIEMGKEIVLYLEELGLAGSIITVTYVFLLSGIGIFLTYWSVKGGVGLAIVLPLLAGSAFGARIGSAATSIVDEDEIKVYLGLMLLGGSAAVAVRELGNVYGIDRFQVVSLVLIVGSALLVCSAVVYSTVSELHKRDTVPSPATN